MAMMKMMIVMREEGSDGAHGRDDDSHGDEDHDDDDSNRND